MVLPPLPPPTRQHRILMVCDMFLPQCGGIELHMYHLACGLVARGHRVTVLTHHYDERKGVRYLPMGIKVYHLPRQPVYNSTTFPTVLGLYRFLRNLMLREQITMIHGHCNFSTMAHEVILMGRVLGLHCIFTDHSLHGFVDTSSHLMNKILKLTCAECHAIICVSHCSRENTVLRACVPPWKIHVIPNAVNATLFTPWEDNGKDLYALSYRDDNHDGKTSPPKRLASPAARSPSRRRRLASPRRPSFSSTPRIVVVSMCRLVMRKGIDLLIDLVLLTCRDHPDVDFLIGGDGPKRAAIENAIASARLEHRVRLLGHVPSERVAGALRQGHVFLNTSLTESFCMANLEAAAAGLLVVSSAVGGVPEVLPSPEMAILAQPTLEPLQVALYAALTRVRRQDAASAASRLERHEAVNQMYRWQDVVFRTERVYDQVMESKRDDAILGRCFRYYQCGGVFGKILCGLILVAHAYGIVVRWLSMQVPRARVDACRLTGGMRG